jgi:hypothetical protein
MSNSPKEILLLHECSKLLEHASELQFVSLLAPFLAVYTKSVSSDNFRVAERALQYWENPTFVSLATAPVLLFYLFPLLFHLSPPLIIFLLARLCFGLQSTRALVFEKMWGFLTGPKHWNATVNKMRANVLEIMEHTDTALFESCAQLANTPIANVRALIRDAKPVGGGAASAADEKARLSARVPDRLKGVGYLSFVFGHKLGEGSFSQVFYAKLIEAGKLGSKWTEYAIKVMDKALLHAQNYEANIKREVLPLLCLRSRQPLILSFFGFAAD